MNTKNREQIRELDSPLLGSHIYNDIWSSNTMKWMRGKRKELGCMAKEWSGNSKLILVKPMKTTDPKQKEFYYYSCSLYLPVIYVFMYIYMYTPWVNFWS